MAFPTMTHDPDALLDYPLNLKVGPDGGPGWLPAGDSLASAEVEVPAALILDHLDVDLTAGVVTPWIKVSPEALGNKKYDFTYHFVSAGGRADDRSRTLHIKER